ncbi:XRE family transcriptional regulator [Alysiella crassa]|uniref:Transcriptional repressor DicA n=1 Tax=Alysiella crassa TaxID=153491 RepID=A0A376BLN3_9NEIS|nr:helix-turn-helix domain-containing protein [Alysiella crassa]UOP07167.1 helix-turn-helix domain-containing protein [Alysiella crassa]SSY70672.1 transcriptional repressor DicA [Alysiella crassa]
MGTNFAERVKERRTELELSQSALAKRAKVSQGTIAQIELGLSQGSGKIVDLAFALGVSPEWLLYGKNPPSELTKSADTQTSSDFVTNTASGIALKKSLCVSKNWDCEYLEFMKANDESMSPTITTFDDVVFNRLETNKQENGIFVIKRTSGTIIIRRLILDSSQRWIYRSDNLDKTRYSDVFENIGDEILGRVVWRGGDNSFN